MKKGIIIVLAAVAVVLLLATIGGGIVLYQRYVEEDIVCADKPVLYLYPEKETQISISLDLQGELTHAYPAYNEGWKVVAKPDGTLTDESGREYYCLFWEGIIGAEYDMSKGFVVPGSETAAFLEEKLNVLGLTEKEANEFIIYWLPRMENNAYNLISFQTEAYTDYAGLVINPEPDSVLRVFMAWQALDEKVDIEEQELCDSFERKGFTVVEWGGAELGGMSDIR